MVDAGTVAISISGIVSSGIVGPLIITWANRSGERAKANRDLVRARRDELRSVLDESAGLLSTGPRLLRRAALADPPDHDRTTDAKEWADRVYPMRERLALRLPTTHPVVRAFDEVRDATTALLEAPTDPRAVAEYDRSRTAYLDAARILLASDLNTGEQT